MLVKIGQIDGFNTIVNSLISSFVVGSYLPLTGGTLTGNLTAPTFIGALQGNATTATTLQTARTIALSGAATGTATSFNGSANISISVTGLNASNLNTGTVPTARLGSGTASSSTVLYGNNTWGTIPVAVDTITRLRGTTSGTLVSGDITLLAGSNTTITQSGNSITIASTNTNTTYSAGTGITLSGTTFSHTAHTGDVTGSTALTIANNVVTFAKMQNITTQKLLGRGTAGTGNIEELTLGTGLALSTTGVLSATGSGGTVTSITAGNGMNFTTISGTGAITLGTPSSISLTSTNSTTSTSHTHALDSATTTAINNGNTAFGWGNHSGLYALVGRSIIAGNGLSGGGTLAANRTITLGTPTAIGLSTTNSVTTTSHTHALDSATITAINQGVTAHGWGNHASENYAKTATDVGLGNVDNYSRADYDARYWDWSNELNGSCASGWVTIANFTTARGQAEFYVWDNESSDHAYIHIHAMRSYDSSSATVTLTSGHQTRIQGVRFLKSSADTTYGNRKLQIRVTATSIYRLKYRIAKLDGYSTVTPIAPVLEDIPSGYVVDSVVDGFTDSAGGTGNTGYVRAGKGMTIGGNQVWHAGNFNPSNYALISQLPTVNNGALTLSTGTGLSGSATFTANQSGTSSFSVGIASTHKLPTTAEWAAALVDTTYSAGTGLSLSGTTFGQAITTSGSGTYVQSITQTASGFQVNLGTPPNTNTTYSNMDIAELNTGTVTSGRIISASVLNQWLNAKGFSTQTLTAGTNISISGNVISATNTDTVTRLRATTSGTYTSGDLTLLAGANTTITQSGASITIASTNTNTTYSAGTGLSLSGTTFGQAITTSGTGTYVQSITQTTSGFQVNLGTPPNTNTTYTGSNGIGVSGTVISPTYGTTSSTIARGDHKHTFLTGWSDTRTVDTVPNDYNSKFEAKGIKQNGVLGLNVTTYGSYTSVIGYRGWSEMSGGQAFELGFAGNGQLLYRSGASTSWGAWNEFIHDGNLDSQATALGFIKSASLSGYVPTSRTITAGNGLSGGGTLAANRTITLGTPSSIGLTSTNSVTSTSHTHELDSATTTAINQGVTAHSWGDFRDFGLGQGQSSVGTWDLSQDYSGFVSASGHGIPGWSTGRAWGFRTSYNSTSYGVTLAMRNGRAAFQTRENGAESGWLEFWHSGNLNPSSFIPSLVTATTAAGVSNVATTNANTYLNIVQGGSSIGSSTQITGTGSVTVTSDAAGKLTINGTNTNTTYTAGTGLTLSGTTFSLPVTVSGSGNYVTNVAASTNGLTVTKATLPVSSLVTATSAAGVSNVATTNTNTYLNIVQDGSSIGSSTQITGSGSVTVTSDAAGKLTINGTNTNTTYSGSTSIILSGTSFQRAALTGDVTASQNSNATTIASNAVTFTKMQNIATQRLLGRSTTGTGNIEEITIGTGLTLTGGVLSAAGSVSQATATVLGGVKLFSNTTQTVAATAVSATASRTYGIQLNSSGQAVVNVPWSNTTYSSGTLTVLNTGTNSTSRVWGASILSNWLNGKGYVKAIRINGGPIVYSNGAEGTMRLFTNNNSGVFYADAVSGSTDIHFHMEDSRRYNFGDGPKNVDYVYEAHINNPNAVTLLNGEKVYVAAFWQANNAWYDPLNIPSDSLMDTYGVMTEGHIDDGVVPIRGNVRLNGIPPHPYLCVFYYFGNGYCEIEYVGFVKLDDICAQKLNGLDYGVVILATFRREYGSLFVDPRIF